MDRSRTERSDIMNSSGCNARGACAGDNMPLGRRRCVCVFSKNSKCFFLFPQMSGKSTSSSYPSMCMPGLTPSCQEMWPCSSLREGATIFQVAAILLELVGARVQPRIGQVREVLQGGPRSLELWNHILTGPLPKAQEDLQSRLRSAVLRSLEIY